LVDVELILGMMDRDQFVNFHNQQDDENVLEIRDSSFRMLPWLL
jgi:RNA recognition motif-containing protein